MNKKMLVLTAVYGIIFTTWCYSGQIRLTSHRNYKYFGIGDGEGKIYFLKHESGGNFDLYRMDEDGSNVSQITNDSMVECYGGGFDISSDKTKLVMTKISDEYDYIYTMNSDGSNAKSIYSTKNRITALKISSDTNKIAFVEFDPINPNGGSLYIINFDGSEVKSLSPRKSISINRTISTPSFAISGSTLTQELVSTNYNIISFSPLSNKIVFLDKYGYLSKINVDGTSMVQITTFTVESPYWLKSDKIIFIKNNYGESALQMINSDGSEYTTIYYSTSSEFSSFSVSPDESKISLVVKLNDVTNANNYQIVVISSLGVTINQIPIHDYGYISWVSNTKLVYSNKNDIFTIDYNGTTPTNLTKNDLETSWTTLDAKGNKIVFANSMDTFLDSTDKKIYSMDIDGTNKVELFSLNTNQHLSDTFVSLSPDGKNCYIHYLREQFLIFILEITNYM
jgi:Tol biopolymer transport system component